jgi:internalin A
LGMGDYRGDWVDLRYNSLDLTPGSPNMLGIETLQGRGVRVDFYSQNLIPSSAVVVNFPDPGLEAAIRDAIEKPTGDIHDTDLFGLTHLMASGSIANLEGIQYCTNLTVLCLREKQIVDISLLAVLTKLEWLFLECNQIVDISALSGLTNLTELYLWDNQIVDISALSGLTNLTKLNLGKNGIVDIATLSGLTNLTELYLWDNQIVDISALSGLTNLTELNLGKNGIVDIATLAGLTKLEWLFLDNNQIVDISALSRLTKLERLRLDNNQIVDISGLSGLTNITELDLQNNQIRDIASLVNNAGIDSGDDVVLLYNLLTLTPGSPNMMDIDTLRRRGVNIFFTSGSVFIFPDPGLEAAIRDAIGKPTGDIHDTDLIRLTSLDANYRNIANLEGIQHCGDLTWLCLTHNQIVDISAVSCLSNLKWLNLEDNQISDITPLVNNQGIHIGNSIALRGNPLLLVPGSQDMLNIETLQRRGVTVFFAAGVAVNFPDPGLEAAIRDTIGKPTGDIHDTDLIGLSFLFEVDRRSGLTNLTILGLDWNEIVDISTLSGLTNLTILDLDWNEIIDISALSGLSNLTWLDLWSNQIVDINALVNNVGLDTGDCVDLRYNSLDLTPGSPDMLDIEALQGREVRIDFDPQD